MKITIKIVPKVVIIPKNMKINPIGIDFTAIGVTRLIRRAKIHIKKVAIDIALSFMISALYSHTMVPDENSNPVIKSSTHVTKPIAFSLNAKSAIKNKVTDITVLPKTMSVFLPKNLSKKRPITVTMKLIIPIMAVIEVADMFNSLNIKFE